MMWSTNWAGDNLFLEGGVYLMKLWKLMMAGVVALGLAGAVVTAEPATVTAQASDNITIDGKFSDWKNDDLTEGYNGYTALGSGGKYVDAYVKMKGQQKMPTSGYTFVVNNKTYHVSLKDIPDVQDGETKAVTVYAGDYYGGNSYGDVGTGYVGKDGTDYVVEFRVDFTKFNLTKADDGQVVTMKNDNVSGDTAATKLDALEDTDDSAPTSTAGVIDGKGDKNAKDTTTTDNDANNDNDNLNIKIDGKFADWKNVTLTGTDYSNGLTAMVSDGNYVYVYVKMRYGTVPGYGDYNFDFNGKKIYVWTDEMPSSPVSSDNPKAVNFTAGEYNEGHQYGTVGNGYVSSNSKGNNIAEFRIDVSKLKLSSMTGQTITMYNPNITNEKVTVAGGSTGPYVIAGIGVLIAGFGYWRLIKSGKLKRRQDDAAGK